MSFVTDNDEHIVLLLQDDKLSIQQKEKLFEQIVNKYKEKLFVMVYNYIKPTGELEDAEDIVIDTFLRFYKNIKKFKFKCSVETFLRRIAINLAINFVKKNKIMFLPLDEKTIISDEKSLTENLTQQEIKKVFLDILNKLPKRQKVAFYLAYYEKMSYKEIADTMNTTVSSVESLLFRAKQNIKKFVLKNKEIAKKLGIDTLTKNYGK